jgi:translation initiation factor IF-3
MRISRKKRPEKITLQYRINEEITAPQLRVINDEGGFIGILPLAEALQISRDKAIDLVEIVPNAKPPVAKLIDYGKFKYQKEKEIKKQKSLQKVVEIKGIRLSLRIGQHDSDMRKTQAIKFLEDGNKVRIEMILRGRERGMGAMAREIIHNFIKEIDAVKPVKVEQPLGMQGGKLSLIITVR